MISKCKIAIQLLQSSIRHGIKNKTHHRRDWSTSISISPLTGITCCNNYSTTTTKLKIEKQNITEPTINLRQLMWENCIHGIHYMYPQIQNIKEFISCHPSLLSSFACIRKFRFSFPEWWFCCWHLETAHDWQPNHRIEVYREWAAFLVVILSVIAS